MSRPAQGVPAVPPAGALPPGRIDGPDAWYGADLRASDAWIHVLDDRDRAELDAALGSVECAGLSLEDVDARAFPLDRLGRTLEHIRAELLRGRGFVLLRGLPVERYDLRRAATVYWGIGRHLGRPVSQNAQGHLLGHVIDLGRSEHDPDARIYQTRARQNYHADSADLVGLLCWRKARRGGLSSIVSSVTLHNEMLAREPALAAELFRVQQVDRRGEVAEGRAPWHEIPVFNWHAGRLSTYYVRRYVESARRFEGVPPLTDAQIAAFDLLDALAEDPDIHLDMAFEPGDMQFLHNPQFLHDRTAYEDYPEPERRRHLLRLWLCPPDGRPLPPAYADRWSGCEPGHRGGIPCTEGRPHAPLLP